LYCNCHAVSTTFARHTRATATARRGAHRTRARDDDTRIGVDVVVDAPSSPARGAMERAPDREDWDARGVDAKTAQRDDVHEARGVHARDPRATRVDTVL